MFSALCLLSLPGLISSFLHPSNSASLGFPKLHQRSPVTLFALPTRSKKVKTHKHKTGCSLQFPPREQDSPFGKSVEEFDLELARQKLEFDKLEFESFVTDHKDPELLDVISHKGPALLDITNTNHVDPALLDEIYLETSSEDSAQSKVWQARILLLVAAALYGTNFTFVKILNESIPVEIGAALRFALAAFATLPFLFLSNKSQNESIDVIDTDTGILAQNESIDVIDTDAGTLAGYGVLLGGMEVGMWNAIGYLSQAVGLETTPASTSAFVCSLAVVVVPLLDYVAGKKILRREVLGALLATAGVAFLELDGLKDGVGAGSGISLSSGDLYTLVQPLAFGLGFWRMEHYMRKFPTDAMKLTAAQLSTIAVVSIGVAMFTSTSAIPDVAQVEQWLSNPTLLAALLWTGLITTALTVAMETFALKTLSAAETTMLFSTEPIFGGICASYVLGEQFGLGGLVGSAMVLGGCLYSNLGAVKTQSTGESSV